MREIKFRAWDTVTKKFFHPWPEGFSIFGETTCFDLMGQQLHEQGRDTLMGLNDLVVEQFIGLKDKNGREIYEGDVLKFSDGYKDNDILAHVVFHKGIFRSVTSVGFPHAIEESSSGGATTIYFYIVGNIHENPELLNA